MRIRVKVCGITTVEDAQLAVEAGADAIGLVFYEPSPRYVAPAVARQIVASLPAFVDAVGVFVNAPRATVRMVLERVGLTALQFHGEEPPELCEGWPVPVVKAIRPRSVQDVGALPLLPVDFWLVDAWSRAERGGTGQLANWEAARLFARRTPVILAGGLRPENVARAVKQVRPYAVDVSSGVENEPGRKDKTKVVRFISAVMQASLELETS